jgi:hypothetical protein
MMMDFWLISLILAFLCAAVGLFLSKASSTKRTAIKEVKERRPDDSAIPVPLVWNEKDISRQLTAIQGNPGMLSYYAHSLKQRFILGTERGTAQARTRFLRSHIEQLELGKQYKVLVNNLRAMEAEQDNRLLKLQVENKELKAKSEQVDAFGKLELDKQRLAIEVEIEQLKAQKNSVGRPDLKPSAAQQRRTRRQEIEKEITELDRQEQLDVKEARSDEERVRIQNLYSERREELREERFKYLP